MRSGPGHRTTQPGFTLVELLVVIAIIALLMTASFGTVRLGYRSFEAGVARANATESMRATSDFLRRQFAEVIPVTHDYDGGVLPAFSGREYGVRFVAPAPRGAGDAALYVYTLSVDAGAAGRQLRLILAPYDPGIPNFDYAAHGTTRSLLEPQADIRFEYFGASADDDRPDWHAEWLADDGALPAAVRIVATGEHGGDAGPPLTFTLRAGDRP